jgi:CheY-like chemotaxis protein
MTIDQKLKDLEIKKVLIVDDTELNIDAAKKYFSRYDGITFDYASSAEHAKKMIQDNYSTQKYDLVMTDMQMEKAKSGLDVVRESFKYQTIAAIVTGKNYDRSENESHGANTQLYIMDQNSSIKGKKEKPEVWEYLFGKVVDFLYTKPPVIASLKRYHEHVGKPSDEVAEMAIMFYE